MQARTVRQLSDLEPACESSGEPAMRRRVHDPVGARTRAQKYRSVPHASWYSA